MNELEVVAAKNEVQKFSDKFEEIGNLGLLWDSKVPEKDKKFPNLISLRKSNKNEVEKEIEKYQNFYQELSEILHKTSNPEDIEYENLMDDLNENLFEMSQAAEDGIKTSSSSAIYKLHESFIQKHERLELMIKKKEVKYVKGAWKKACQSIETLESRLRRDAEKNDQIRNDFDELMSKHEQLLEEHKVLINENRQMEEKTESLLENNKKMDEKIEYLIETIKRMEQKQEILLQQNAAFEVMLETKKTCTTNAVGLLSSM